MFGSFTGLAGQDSKIAVRFGPINDAVDKVF